MRWYTLQQAWEYRGGGAWSTFLNDPLDHPKLGIPDAHQHGRRVWSRETIERWAEFSDETRAGYYDELVEEDPGAFIPRLQSLGDKDAGRYREYIAALTPALPV